METHNTNDRPHPPTIFRLYVYPSEAQAKKGWTVHNSETYYEVDTFFKTIVLRFKSKWDTDDKVVKWNQYADHKGGSFTVSEKQYQDFKRFYKRVKAQTYKVEEIK